MENVLLPMANGGISYNSQGNAPAATTQSQTSQTTSSPQSVADPDTTTARGELTDASLPDARGYAGLVGAGFNAATHGKASSGVNAVAGLVDGKPAVDVGIDVVGAVLGGWAAKEGLFGSLPGLLGPAVGITANVTKEAFKDDPSYGKAAVQAGVPSLASMVGTTLGGPLVGLGVGMLAGYATNTSLSDGLLGDMTDSRSREKDREAVESKMGMSYGDTAMMSRADTFGDLPSASGYGFGLTDAVSSTTKGNLAEAATNAFGDPKSLSSYADGLDLGEFDGVDNSTDNSGKDGGPGMGDSGGRSGGDPDGGPGSDPN